MPELPGADAAKGIITQSFASVFKDLNRATEARYQRFRVKRVTRDRYADYVVRTVGTFPLFGTTQHASVESAYVRIGLSARLERERYRSHGEIEESLRSQRAGGSVDPLRHADSKTLLDVLNESARAVALLGNPGSGKTTSLRHLAVLLAKGTLVRGRRQIPLFLSVRDLALGAQSVEGAAVAFLEWLEVVEPALTFQALLKSGDVAILLDGIDEAERALQAKLLRELTKVIDEYPDVVVCVSGRPYSLGMGLSQFQKWETLPLTTDEKLSLVRAWYQAVDPAKGAKLLAECKDDPSILDLGTNPLLLAIVCALYYNDLKIPTEPDELYARTVEGLLGAWDAFRNIARETPLRDLSVRRRTVLVSWIAATMFERGRLVFSARDIEDARILVKFASSTQTPELQPDELLKALYNDFGILIERAPGLFSFSHLTFHEYLTAQYVVDNRREIELVRRRAEPRWREVLRLAAKMLPNANMYMAALSEAVDLANADDLGFLIATWGMRPICDPFETAKSMRLVADRAARAVKPLQVAYRLKNGRVLAELNRNRTSVFRDSIRDQLAVLTNLPAIVRMFNSVGVSLSALQLDHVVPFSFLTANPPPAIEVVESSR